MKFVVSSLAFIFLVFVCLLISVITLKFVWFYTGMGEWTGLGSLPWGPALFLALLPVGFNISGLFKDS